MPEISRFLGIVVKMFWNDHNPPHFHAYYGSDQAILEIGSFRVSRRSPSRESAWFGD
jgi:hypothetical protein